MVRILLYPLLLMFCGLPIINTQCSWDDMAASGMPARQMPGEAPPVGMEPNCWSYPANAQFVYLMFLETFRKPIPDAVNKFFSVPYYQHNPFAASGRQSLVTALAAMAQAPTPPKFTVRHIVGDGRWVAVHYTMEQGTLKQHVVDWLYLDEQCQVFEHWDTVDAAWDGNEAEVSGGPSQASFVGTSPESTEANKAMIPQIYRAVYCQGNNAVAKYLATNFNDRTGTTKVTANPGSKESRFRIKRMAGAGNLVFVHGHETSNVQDCADDYKGAVRMDVWEFDDDNKAVNLWTVRQLVPPKDQKYKSEWTMVDSVVSEMYGAPMLCPTAADPALC